jgi:2-polyprenyl-3-methyl-5-hydroxy-6-metoxy-1,4-benzoquinol methylase
MKARSSSRAAREEHKRYDEGYFERWYRAARTRVHSPDDVDRKVHLAVAAAEYMLGREIVSVLDVGAGEGAWQPTIRRLRPEARYLGVEPSEYAVRKFGVRRNLVRGSLDGLDDAGVRGRFDLVVCADVLNYVGSRELRRGLEQITARLRGVAYLELYTSDDELTGDLHNIDLRAPAYYRRLLRQVGLIRCGMHCYASDEIASRVTAMEGGW